MLLGRVAVVTGGATGIGRAIAQRLAREGARVVVGDVDAEGGSATARGIVERGGQALFVPTNMTRRDDVRAMVRSAVDEYGGLHVLVNNAVRFVFGHVAGAGTRGGDGLDREVSDADWDAVFRTNVVGYARAIEEAVPYFRENSLEGGPVYDNDQGEGVTRINAASRGSVVNIASVSGYIAQPSFVPYNASKGAVLQLTRCCAMDLAPDKIRVNAICPGTIETQVCRRGIRWCTPPTLCLSASRSIL